MEPDAIIIQDVTLLHQVDLFAGLATEGFVLVNTSQSLDDLGLGEFGRPFQRDRLLTCPQRSSPSNNSANRSRTPHCSADSPR